MELSHNPRTLLRPYNGPGLFITGTGTDVGKTTVAAALAAAFQRLHLRVGICKPLASGCPKWPHRGNNPSRPLADEDFQSPDAAFAARAAGLDPADETLLAFLSPLRYAAPVAPAVAARIEGRPPDWRRVVAALDWWQENCQALLIEGSGGWYSPLDEHDFMKCRPGRGVASAGAGRDACRAGGDQRGFADDPCRAGAASGGGGHGD